MWIPKGVTVIIGRCLFKTRRLLEKIRYFAIKYEYLGLSILAFIMTTSSGGKIRRNCNWCSSFMYCFLNCYLVYYDQYMGAVSALRNIEIKFDDSERFLKTNCLNNLDWFCWKSVICLFIVIFLFFVWFYFNSLDFIYKYSHMFF